MKQTNKAISKLFYSYLPENFVLEQHIQKYDPDLYAIPQFNTDHGKYLLSQIHEAKEANNYKTNFFHELLGGYTQLQASVLQSVVQDYKIYMVYFQDTGIIECDGQYIVSDHDKGIEGKSYGYRYTSQYVNSKIVTSRYSEYFNSLLCRKWKKHFYKGNVNHLHLTKWLEYIEIDGKTAYNYITIRCNAQLKEPKLIDYKQDKKTGKKRAVSPQDQFNHNKIVIHKIESGNQFVLVDNTVHRMYTHLTSIKKELRNLIIFKKHGITSRLICIDIVNSQPYLVSMLLDINKSNNNINLIQSFNNPTLNKPLLMLKSLYSLFENEGFIYEDVILYRSLVSDSLGKLSDGDGNPYDLYTYMLDHCVAKNIHFSNRGEIKTGMMGVMFGSNDVNTNVKELFKELFPTVWKVFCHIKEKEQRGLSCLLQNIESHFILNVITKGFAERYRNAPLYTIHDSIATTEEYKIRLLDFMKEKLRKLVGLAPMLKIEEWAPENIDWSRYTNVL